MHNFLQGTLKHYGIFVFLLVHTAVILAMESPNHHRSLSPKQGLPLKPDQIVQIFDSKKEVKKGILWDDLIPKNIIITPDGKGLILAKRGKVEGFSFDDPSNVKIIIEHPKAKKSFPIIAVSQKKDGLLTIISASNYKNENNEHVAEYILFCNEWTTGKKLDKPIQALSRDS